MEPVDVRDFNVDAASARGIRDPYTGEELRVVGRVAGRIVTYSAPGAFTLAEPQSSIEVLYDRASMRNGIAGSVSRDESLVCAYTGKRMSLERTPDGKWYLSGGFNPRRGRLSLAEFISLATGRTVSDPPKAESVPRMPAPKAETPDTDAIGEELLEASEKFCAAAGLDRGRTTVSVPDKPKRARNRG